MEKIETTMNAESVDFLGSEQSLPNHILPHRINVDHERVDQGLAKLVLTLVELIRKLVEKQALRRVEGGSLTSEEVERLGITLMRLEEKMKELKVHFGLDDEDLNIDLGPLGKLI